MIKLSAGVGIYLISRYNRQQETVHGPKKQLRSYVMEKILIFGHKNPDTDTICSAMAYADLKSKLGLNVEPVRLGEINGETQFALNHFQAAAPRLVETVANEAKSVILVDHNERQQSASDIDQVKVIEVIDHHRIANFETGHPLYYRAEPVGCTATILNKLYKENGIAISKQIAGLMLSAIISDSLLFKSPTCTDQDVAAARELAAIAGVNADTYGLDMLKAGADLSQKTISQLLSLDAKEFQMGSRKVEIAQVNAVDTNDVLARQAELETALSALIADKGLDLFVFVVTDILNNDSVALVLGREAKAVEQAYDVTLVNNTALLKGVVSRKLQIVPVLTDILSKH
jgi:manganese-dependent inorganic pyrophosphatase